jgi:cell division protease FtsH
MGLISYERPHNPFLKGELWQPTEREYSDQVAAEIDEEVKRILEAAKERTRRILSAWKPLLEKTATRLLEVEVINREEFERMLAAEGVVRPVSAQPPAVPVSADGRRKLSPKSRPASP